MGGVGTGAINRTGNIHGTETSENPILMARKKYFDSVWYKDSLYMYIVKQLKAKSFAIFSAAAPVNIERWKLFEECKIEHTEKL